MCNLQKGVNTYKGGIIMMMIPRHDWGMNLFDDMIKDPFLDEGRRTRRNELMTHMRTDIIEKDGKYELKMDLPGYKKEDINIDVEDGYLTIRATHSEEKDDSDKKYIHKERFYGECSRSFYIGEDVNLDEIKASFENGILNLEFPKVEEEKEEKKKTITIE